MKRRAEGGRERERGLPAGDAGCWREKGRGVGPGLPSRHPYRLLRSACSGGGSFGSFGAGLALFLEAGGEAVEELGEVLGLVCGGGAEAEAGVAGRDGGEHDRGNEDSALQEAPGPVV